MKELIDHLPRNSPVPDILNAAAFVLFLMLLWRGYSLASDRQEFAAEFALAQEAGPLHRPVGVMCGIFSDECTGTLDGRQLMARKRADGSWERVR